MAEDIDTKQQEAQSDTSAGTGAGAGNVQQQATFVGSAGSAPGGQFRSTGPVGSGNYEVQQGDCMSSIAKRHGYFWNTLWNHPDNAELQNVRKNPNVLLPGDRVTLPPLRIRYESGHTEQRHRFRRKGEPSNLRLRFLQENDPRAGDSYVLETDLGATFRGQLDQDGCLVVCIPGDTASVRVTLGDVGERELYEFDLGCTNPIEDLEGIQQRLRNLGFVCDPESELGESTRAAIEQFQMHRNLKGTGQPDGPTRQSLLDTHGS